MTLQVKWKDLKCPDDHEDMPHTPVKSAIHAVYWTKLDEIIISFCTYEELFF